MCRADKISTTKIKSFFVRDFFQVLSFVTATHRKHTRKIFLSVK